MKVKWNKRPDSGDWNLSGVTATAFMCTRKIFDGGFLCVAAEYLVRFLQFILLVLIWKSLAEDGADLGGISAGQMFTYTLMASVWRQQLDIITPATSALWEGSIIGRYTRPIPVISGLIGETIGRWWIPVFFFYSLPLWLAAPLMGIRALPVSGTAGALAVFSLALSASLGFAMDMIFSSVAMHLKNGCWAATQIRESVYALLSGALIPYAVLPWGLGEWLAWLPFGSFIGNFDF